jgi:hypothetical protein
VTVAAEAHQTTTSTTALVADQNVVTTTQVVPIYGKNIQINQLLQLNLQYNLVYNRSLLTII